MLEQEGVRLGIGGGLLLAATATCVATGITGAGATAAVFAVATLLFRVVRKYGALLLAVTGWALATGFGVNELGQLTFRGPDLVRLLVIVAGAIALGRRAPAAP
ncbi:hypothetical protein GCM10022242_13010 [Nocardioides panacisoli]|uniref:Uncharacterized protein n=2 Tax=Nocardioides panacisoli TaxID=627624 RepID=A0ABP7I849_9ACTN